MKTRPQASARNYVKKLYLWLLKLSFVAVRNNTTNVGLLRTAASYFRENSMYHYEMMVYRYEVAALPKNQGELANKLAKDTALWVLYVVMWWLVWPEISNTIE